MAVCVATNVAASAAEWKHVRQIEIYTIHSDFSLEPYAELIEDLASLRTDVASVLKLPIPDEQIDVYLFAEKSTYESYMRHYFPGTVARRAMFIKSNSPGNVFAFKSDQFAVDLRHEVTHAILNAMLPTVPLWLDEGLAEYFELPTAERINGHEHLGSTKSRAFWFRHTSLAKLEGLLELEQMGQRQYRDAWAWIHFMINGPPEARTALIDYLGQLERHQTPGSLSQWLKREMDDPDKRFVEHFRKWKS